MKSGTPDECISGVSDPPKIVTPDGPSKQKRNQGAKSHQERLDALQIKMDALFERFHRIKEEMKEIRLEQEEIRAHRAECKREREQREERKQRNQRNELRYCRTDDWYKKSSSEQYCICEMRFPVPRAVRALRLVSFSLSARCKRDEYDN